MREIKFRTWDKLKNCWADHNQQLSDVSVSASVNTPSILTVGDDRYELNLFTGLKDKNGKDIYEADVVFVETSEGSGGTYHLVEWKMGGFQLNEIGYGLECWMQPRLHYLEDAEYMGNIYDNPELVGK